MTNIGEERAAAAASEKGESMDISPENRKRKLEEISGKEDGSSNNKNGSDDNEGKPDGPNQQKPGDSAADAEASAGLTVKGKEYAVQNLGADGEGSSVPVDQEGGKSNETGVNGDEEKKDETGEKAEAASKMDVDMPDDSKCHSEEKTASSVQLEAEIDNEKSKKNPYESLKYIIVRNDGKPESMIKLVGLKSLFAKQLPKMPRAYIARLVFDPRHASLAILADNPALKDSDEEIIGGICYLAFPEMRFAEIAFCAVNANHQVKGYGTKLMNLLKKIGAETGIEYFITYADNYAIGYFKKQGFTKAVQMPKGRHFGLIKHYDGGTMMECYVHPSVDYTRIPEMLSQQRKFILDRIALVAQSNKTVYPPLVSPQSADTGTTAASSLNSSSNVAGSAGANTGDGTVAVSATGTAALSAAAPSVGGEPASALLISATTGVTVSSRGTQSAARAMAVPGMIAAGWTLADLTAAAMASSASSDKDSGTNAPRTMNLKTELLQILRKIQDQQFAWPFREPVNPKEVPDYLEVIKEPIDLSTMEKRVRQDAYYKSKQMLYNDLRLMINNCKLYNDETSVFVECAVSLEKMLPTLFRKEDLPTK